MSDSQRARPPKEARGLQPRPSKLPSHPSLRAGFVCDGNPYDHCQVNHMP